MDYNYDQRDSDSPDHFLAGIDYERKPGTSVTIYALVKCDYMDDNNVIHIDAYKSLYDDEDGQCIGYVINGMVYPVNHDTIYTDPLAKLAVARAKLKHTEMGLLKGVDEN